MKRYRLLAAQAGWPEQLEYRLIPSGHTESFGIGEEFECELTEADEAEHIASGLLEVVKDDGVRDQ